MATLDPAKYPKMPALLWDRDSDKQTPREMALTMLRMFDPSGKFQKEHNIVIH